MTRTPTDSLTMGISGISHSSCIRSQQNWAITTICPIEEWNHNKIHGLVGSKDKIRVRLNECGESTIQECDSKNVIN